MSANKCVKGHNHSDLCYVVAIELIELNALVAVGDKTTYLEIGIWVLRFALCDLQCVKGGQMTTCYATDHLWNCHLLIITYNVSSSDVPFNQLSTYA